MRVSLCLVPHLEKTFIVLEPIITLILTTALLLGSPGPAPIALAASGAAFGVKNSLPFLIGILLGLAVAVIGAAFGLAALFEVFPQARLICQIVGAAYICYVAYKIASSSLTQDGAESDAPTMRDGFIFNLLNPKAYAAFLAIFSQFLLPLSNSTASYLFTALTCLVVAAVVDTIWLLFGSILKPIFNKPTQAKIIRLVFAIGMVAAVLWAFM